MGLEKIDENLDEVTGLLGICGDEHLIVQQLQKMWGEGLRLDEILGSLFLLLWRDFAESEIFADMSLGRFLDVGISALCIRFSKMRYKRSR